jgi:hypothetical protein
MAIMDAMEAVVNDDVNRPAITIQKRERGAKRTNGDVSMDMAIANLCARSNKYGNLGNLRYVDVKIGKKAAGSQAGGRYALIAEGLPVRDHAKLVWQAAIDSGSEYAYRQVQDIAADILHDTARDFYSVVRIG